MGGRGRASRRDGTGDVPPRTQAGAGGLVRSPEGAKPAASAASAAAAAATAAADIVVDVLVASAHVVTAAVTAVK